MGVRENKTVMFQEKSVRIFGYENTEDDDCILMEMSEVTICSTPEALREIATFIQNAADELEVKGNNFDHSHLRDKWSGWDQSGADIIIGQSKT